MLITFLIIFSVYLDKRIVLVFFVINGPSMSLVTMSIRHMTLSSTFVISSALMSFLMNSANMIERSMSNLPSLESLAFSEMVSLTNKLASTQLLRISCAINLL